MPAHGLHKPPMEDLASRSVALTREADHWAGRFMAMASPCEVLIETPGESLARGIANTVAECAWRIERKFSRYRTDNVVHAINRGDGTPISVEKSAKGLVITGVNPDSRAAEAGLQEGDVIVEVNRKTVTSVDELRTAVRGASQRPVLLLVEREGQTRFVTVRPSA